MASSKYKIKAKSPNTAQQSSHTGTNDSKPIIGKGKIILILIFGTALVAGIYMAAIQKMFAPIMHIYWILTTILLMAFLYIKSRNEYLYTKITANGKPSEEDKKAHIKRTKAMKYLLLVLLPFLFTLIGDAVYLFILKDLDIIGAIKNLI